MDAALGGGLACGRIHEVHAADPADAAAATGFIAAICTGMAGPDRQILWLRTDKAARLGGALQAEGWRELGIAPEQVVLGILPDTLSLLRAGIDALRCAALGVVVLEGWAAMRELDLTASRRLVLAAERSGVSLLLLRIDSPPAPSAAQTRWEVRAAPSHALPGQAPGQPTFDISLVRQRSGPSGLTWRVEWDRDQHKFRQPTLSGAVVSVPAGRPATAGERPGRQAA